MSRWLRRGALVLAAVLLLRPGSAAPGVIEGRVIHPTRPEAAADLEVSLLGLRPGGAPVQQSTRTNAEGRFRFEQVEPGGYFVATSFEGISFPGGRATFSPDDPDRTESMTFHIYDQSDDASGLQVRRLRWIIEREAGVYRISTTLTVNNRELKVVNIDPQAEAPLRIPLAEGHGDLETPFGQLPAGVSQSDGVVELRGPFFPGNRQYLVAHDMSGDGAALQTEFEVPDGVEFVELLVRDFGVATDVSDLHPARTVREGDEAYLRWVGFEPPAGSRVPVRLEALPPRRAAPRGVQAVLVALLAGGVLLYVLGPLGGAAARELAPATTSGTDEREAVFAALRDLEDDFETGKVSPEDREKLRSDLRKEALRAMAREQERAGPAEERPPVEACSCGRVPQAADRFCAACGKEL
jgi:hypothetical protein